MTEERLIETELAAGNEPEAERRRLGEFEELVLLAILKLSSEPAYGMNIIQALKAVGRPASVGAVYSSLNKLTRKGYLTPLELLPEDKTRGASPNKNGYAVTATGIEALRQAEFARRLLMPNLWDHELGLTTTVNQKEA